MDIEGPRSILEDLQRGGAVSIESVPTPIIEQKLEGIDRTVEKKEKLKQLFVKLALSDFHHDFHEFKIQKFLEEYIKNPSLTSTLSSIERARRVNAIRTHSTSSKSPEFINYFKQYVKLTLDIASSDDKYLNEDDIVNQINLNFIELKKELIEWSTNEDAGTGFKNNPVYVPTDALTTITNRIYDIKTVIVKDKTGIDETNEDDKYKDITQVFVSLVDPINMKGAATETATLKTYNFFLIIDASFLAMSRLLVNGQKIAGVKKFPAGTVINFYILQSIENDSDSATKINKLDKSDRTDIKINVHILKDTGNISVFPNYMDPSDSQNANLFSKLKFTTRRNANDEVDATVEFDENNKREFPNIGKLSQRTGACTISIQELVENWVKDENSITPEIKKQIGTYFLLKRAGDWCQVLCLLDQSREYEQYTFDNSTGKLSETVKEKRILHEIIKEVDDANSVTKLGLLTHDRILLTYALLMGVNVFFSVFPFANRRSVLTYFENSDTSVTQEIIDAETKRIDILYNGSPEKPGINVILTNFDDLTTNYTKKITTWLENLNTSIDGWLDNKPITNLTYLQFSRFFAYMLTTYPDTTKLETLKREIDNLNIELTTLNSITPKTSKELVKIKNALLQKEICLTKYKIMYDEIDKSPNFEINKSLEDYKYPNKQQDYTQLNALYHVYRNSEVFDKSATFLAFSSGVFDGFIQDLRLVKKLHTGFSLDETKKWEITHIDDKASRKQGANLSQLNKLINNNMNMTIIEKPSKKQKGGAIIRSNEDLKKAYDNIRTRRIYVVKDKKFLEKADGTSVIQLSDSTPTDDTKTSKQFTAVLRQYVTDEQCNYYSVLDNFIIDNSMEVFFAENDDYLTELRKVGAQINQPNTPEEHYENYLSLRYYLLLHDRYYTRLTNLISEYNSVDNDDPTINNEIELSASDSRFRELTEYIINLRKRLNNDFNFFKEAERERKQRVTAKTGDYIQTTEREIDTLIERVFKSRKDKTIGFYIIVGELKNTFKRFINNINFDEYIKTTKYKYNIYFYQALLENIRIKIFAYYLSKNTTLNKNIRRKSEEDYKNTLIDESILTEDKGNTDKSKKLVGEIEGDQEKEGKKFEALFNLDNDIKEAKEEEEEAPAAAAAVGAVGAVGAVAAVAAVPTSGGKRYKRRTYRNRVKT